LIGVGGGGVLHHRKVVEVCGNGLLAE
jgi:hypothetical protein